VPTSQSPEREEAAIPPPHTFRGVDSVEHLFDTGWVEYVEPPPPWEVGRQDILNTLEAQMPQHTFKTPVPVVARIEWEHDGEEHIETVAWAGPANTPTFAYQTRATGSPPCGSTPATLDAGSAASPLTARVAGGPCDP
jgi:hypothetical protein